MYRLIQFLLLCVTSNTIAFHPISNNYVYSIQLHHQRNILQQHQRPIISSKRYQTVSAHVTVSKRSDRLLLKQRLLIRLHATTNESKNLIGFIDSAIESFFGSKRPSYIQQLRQERKDALLALVLPNNNVNQSTNIVQERTIEIENAINALAELSPVTSSDDISRLLNKVWYLVWTTEKEINLFITKGWSNNITQQIIIDTNTIINNIPFVNNNGYFSVTGRINRNIVSSSNNDTVTATTITSSNNNNNNNIMIRTEFEFETATLQWILPFPISFPPVGKGWFDTVYIDDTFRVDRNSRNDILICQSKEQ